MCLVSMVMDYGRTLPNDYWTPRTWLDYQELIEKARKWDELTKQKDCEDPEKAAWVKDIERRLTELEKKV